MKQSTERSAKKNALHLLPYEPDDLFATAAREELLRRALAEGRNVIRVADLFCGAGGTSSGVRDAVHAAGAVLDLTCVNHWDKAVASHAANHPTARHVCMRLDGVRIRELVPEGHLHLLVASPECTNHSKAKAGVPLNDQSRAGGWQILDRLTQIHVENFLFENVPEWRLWGPLGANGKPDKDREGEIFDAFVAAIRAIGYNVGFRTVNCANFGDPTARRRLIMLGKREGEVPWAQETHGPAGSGLLPYRTARDIVDWDDLGMRASEKKNLGARTRRRLEIGREMFGGEPFVLTRLRHTKKAGLAMSDSELAKFIRSIDEPLHTITTTAWDIPVCTPARNDTFYRMLRVPELKRAMSLPADYVLYGTLEDQVKQIGNAVPTKTVAAHVSALCGLDSSARVAA